jgi:RHS repeat-associated protein
MAHAAGALAFAGSIGYAAGNGSSGGGHNGNGNGNGGNGGGGNGNGNGNGNAYGHGPSHQPGAPGHGSGGHGQGGSFNVNAPQPLKEPPVNFQDQNAARRSRPDDPQAPTFIQSNLLPDCGANCGGNIPAGAGGNDPYFAAARTLPENRTGEMAGVDPGSRNFNWSMPLVNLSGRAGLDLNIALHYNSLVWTKQGNSVQFNADHGFPGPGFRLGFPVVQTRFLNSGGAAYLLETSSGGREEMRRLGGSDSMSNTYEAPDGSNTQLVEYYRLVSPFNGKCLDVSAVSQSNGARLHQWDCLNVPNQQWQIVPTDSGYYKILARHSGKSVDVEGAYGHSGAYVHQWDYVGGANQQWRFVPTGNGSYQIIARHSGKLLSADYSYSNGGPITQADNYYSDHQTWQLEPVAGQMVVRTTDGTQLSFVYNSAVYEYRCTQIKDRNGNYITINYDPGIPAGALGRPTSVVDTLGRVLSFNYDEQKYLRSITQWWRRESNTGATVIENRAWATFDYELITVQTNFRNPSNNNPLIVHGPGASPIPMLSKLGLPDGTKYEFVYTVWGQVHQIKRLAPDGHLLARESYNLPTDTVAPQSDCPRMSERRDWAQDWNNGAEAITNYAETKNHTWLMPDQSWHTGTMTQASSPIYYVFEGTPRTNVAYRVVQRTYAHATGWDNGLPLLERTYQQRVSDGYETLRRTVWTNWTQDNTSVNYPINPRPVEINVDDPQGNRKRTTIQYTAHGLPEMVREWGGANASQVLRRTYYQYNLDNVYVSRRMIGLPGITQIYEGENTLMSKVEYHYDWANHFTALAPSTQHDSSNYSASFTAGRGLVVGVLRYNKDMPNDSNQAMWVSFSGYDLAGSTLWMQDGHGHRANIDYADSFWTDSTNTRNTRAYPTRFTDADSHFSTAEYNYDLGTVTRAQGPPPAGQTQGVIQTMRYDSAGRIERVTNQVNDAYARYEYDPNYGHTRTYTTTKDLNSIAYTNTIRDGAGQVRLFVASHPGSVGGYRAQLMSYDALGRVVERTSMTEITGGGTPIGDDAAGYQRTLQWYDWKGRLTLTTFPNGNTVEADYGGCGCAGGEVVTTRDERGRRKKLYRDTLGRLAKVEEMNWLESQGVYSTTNYAYNGRDQITNINQQGQTRNFGYDGHGRLISRQTPEQGTTTYSYYGDDTTHVVTDARGATTTFGYNGRHQPTGITYGVPAGVAPTTNVTLAYDAAGNRTSMTDGLGSMSYAYDRLSRLTSETRTFTNVGTYTLAYEYNLAGALTRVTNPWNAQVSYAHDAEGRTAAINGANYGGVSTYAHSLKYRAWGALKEATYGNGGLHSQLFDNRLRLTGWHVANVMGWNYSYDKFGEHTGRVTYAQSTVDPTLNRSYDYDQVGRLWEAHSGNEADAHVALQPFPAQPDGPLSHSYRYDQYGNMTHRVGWGGTFANYTNQYRSFTNNRQDGLVYDVAGNLTNDGAQYTYDANGQQVNGTYPPAWGGYANYSLQQGYDGDGLRAMKTDNGVTTYVLRSSMLGNQVVAELQFWNNNWNWGRGFVYLGGQLLALQMNSSVTWVHQDPVVKSQRLTNMSGSVTTGIELDSWGGETGRSWNSQQQSRKFTSYERDGSGNDQAMFRQYHSYWMRFDQPDPYGGSYNMTDPQSLNRYAYVGNDPVNYVDPTGLNKEEGSRCGRNGIWIKDPIDNSLHCAELPDEEVTVTAADPWDDFDVGNGGTFDWVSDRLPPSLTDAIDVAKGALKDPESRCAKLFAKGNGLELLTQLEKKGKIKIGDTKVPKHLSSTGKLKDAPGVAGVAKDGKIFLNPASSIVKGTVNPRSAVFGGMSAVDALAALIIHEVLHISKDRPPETGENYRIDSLLNSTDVKAACFPGYP